MTWQVMGLREKVQREMLATGLPDDLAQEFHALSEWAGTLPAKFGNRIRVRLIDAVSLEGFATSLRRRFWRYPAFSVQGRRYVGSDFSQVDALISAQLAKGGDADAPRGQ